MSIEFHEANSMGCDFITTPAHPRRIGHPPRTFRVGARAMCGEKMGDAMVEHRDLHGEEEKIHSCTFPHSATARFANREEAKTGLPTLLRGGGGHV